MSSLSLELPCPSESIEGDLTKHELWQWSAGIWVKPQEDPAAVAVITFSNFRCITAYSPMSEESIFFSMPGHFAIAPAGSRTFDIQTASLVLHPATQGILMDRIVKSPIVEEMNIRGGTPDTIVPEPCITVWFSDGNQMTVSGKDKGKLLCAVLLEVLNLTKLESTQVTKNEHA